MMDENYELKVGPPGKFSFGLKELWQYRELLYFFTWRDVKVRYKQTVLGIVWVLLQPLVSVLIFSIFFGRALKIPSGGIPYPVFVLSGLILWNAFSASLVNAGTSMVSNASIIRKIYFPRLIIPIASILVAFIDLFVAFCLLLLMLWIYPVDMNWISAIVCWPLALMLMLFANVGLSCWLAALNVKYRDFKYVVPFALQIMLFLSPVIYPINLLYYPGLEYVLALNPMYGVIELFRFPMLHELDLVLFSISTASSLVLVVIGLVYFKSTEHFFADFA